MYALYNSCDRDNTRDACSILHAARNLVKSNIWFWIRLEWGEPFNVRKVLFGWMVVAKQIFDGHRADAEDGANLSNTISYT